jgi:hypothetical protein
VTPALRAVAVALSFVLLGAPSRLQSLIGGDTRQYLIVTIVLALLDGWLVFSWATTSEISEPLRITNGRRRVARVALAGGAAAALVLFACWSWLRLILTIPIDPFRGDMLVVVREGLRRLLAGQNPYAKFLVPWEAALVYGPMLWAPYAVPAALRIDLRWVSVIGELFMPIACAAAAAFAAIRGRMAQAIAAIVLLGAVVFNRELAGFTPVAHTPAYWPLVVLFAWLTTRERWRAAAITLGLLVVARSTMIAMVPVLLMTVWQRDGRQFTTVLALMTLAIALPLVPFAVVNLDALVYALYGSYQKVIKQVVWADATVPHTIGLTGILLSHHAQRAVEIVQIAVLAADYAVCWWALRRGRAPIGLMGGALLAFSMTTLWPVTYIYFDVFLVFAAGVIAEMLFVGSPRSPVSVWTAALCASVLLVSGIGFAMLPAEPETSAIAWRDGPKIGTIVCVERRATAAIVEIETGSEPADIDLSLNGLPLGHYIGRGAGAHLLIAAPASLWHTGANSLDFGAASASAIRGATVHPVR